MTTYEVIDDFQARNMSVLLLDREYKVVIPNLPLMAINADIRLTR